MWSLLTHGHANEHGSRCCGRGAALFHVMKLLFQFTSHFARIPFMLALALGRKLSWEALPSRSLTRIQATRRCCRAEKLLVWRQESCLCNAACHRGFVPPCWPHSEPFLRCVWSAVWLSCGNSTLPFAGFRSWNSLDLRVSGRKTLPASGCNVEDHFFPKFLGVFAFGLFCLVVFEVISSMPFRMQQVYFRSILLLTHYQNFKRQRN